MKKLHYLHSIDNKDNFIIGLIDVKNLNLDSDLFIEVTLKFIYVERYNGRFTTIMKRVKKSNVWNVSRMCIVEIDSRALYRLVIRDLFNFLRE